MCVAWRRGSIVGQSFVDLDLLFFFLLGVVVAQCEYFDDSGSDIPPLAAFPHFTSSLSTINDHHLLPGGVDVIHVRGGHQFRRVGEDPDRLHSSLIQHFFSPQSCNSLLLFPHPSLQAYPHRARVNSWLSTLWPSTRSPSRKPATAGMVVPRLPNCLASTTATLPTPSPRRRALPSTPKSLAAALDSSGHGMTHGAGHYGRS